MIRPEGPTRGNRSDNSYPCLPCTWRMHKIRTDFRIWPEDRTWQRSDKSFPCLSQLTLKFNHRREIQYKGPALKPRILFLILTLCQCYLAQAVTSHTLALPTSKAFKGTRCAKYVRLEEILKIFYYYTLSLLWQPIPIHYICHLFSTDNILGIITSPHRKCVNCKKAGFATKQRKLQ